MSKIKFLIPFLFTILIAVSCKKEMSLSEYKYANNDYTLECENYQLELIKEAVYSFEDDINKHFEKKGTKNLSQAYSRFVNLRMYGRLQHNEIVSDHTKEILSILKEEKDLWTQTSKGWSLNYNHPIISCISNNMNDKDLQTTFNALISTNSMSQKLFGEAIRSTSYKAIRDKSLATYIALDFYYAQLLNADLSNSKKQSSKDAQVKPDVKIDPHAGHNH